MTSAMFLSNSGLKQPPFVGLLIGNLKAKDNPRKLKHNNRDFIIALAVVEGRDQR